MFFKGVCVYQSYHSASASACLADSISPFQIFRFGDPNPRGRYLNYKPSIGYTQTSTPNSNILNSNAGTDTGIVGEGADESPPQANNFFHPYT